MAMVKVSMQYDSKNNTFIVKGLKKTAPAEVLERILETIKEEADPNSLHDLTIKLMGEQEVAILSLKDFTTLVQETLEEITKEELEDTVEITFYLKSGCTLFAAVNIDTASYIMSEYEGESERTSNMALFTDINNRHYAIPFDNIVAAYCDYIKKDAENDK